jgi:hypothetical protein
MTKKAIPSIQPQITQDALLEIRALFKRQKRDNVIEVYLKQPLRGNPGALEFGGYLIDHLIIVHPFEIQRNFSGTELAAAIAEFYSKDYWLLALWRQLSLKAGSSAIAREIVRAFVKTCILTTAGELIGHGVKGLDAQFVVKNGLIKRVPYYQTIFDWSRIYRNIRQPSQRVIRKRLNKSGKGTPGFYSDPGTETLSRLQNNLDDINKLLKDSDLPQIITDSHAQKDNLHGILRSVYLQALFWRDSTNLRKELRRFLGASS